MEKAKDRFKRIVASSPLDLGETFSPRSILAKACSPFPRAVNESLRSHLKTLAFAKNPSSGDTLVLGIQRVRYIPEWGYMTMNGSIAHLLLLPPGDPSSAGCADFVQS